MRPPLILLALAIVASCVSYSQWSATGHVSEFPCGGNIGVRPADFSTDDEVDDWGVSCQVRTPILEPCREGGE